MFVYYYTKHRFEDGKINILGNIYVFVIKYKQIIIITTWQTKKLTALLCFLVSNFPVFFLFY